MHVFFPPSFTDWRQNPSISLFSYLMCQIMKKERKKNHHCIYSYHDLLCVNSSWFYIAYILLHFLTLLTIAIYDCSDLISAKQKPKPRNSSSVEIPCINQTSVRLNVLTYTCYTMQSFHMSTLTYVKITCMKTIRKGLKVRH